MTQQPNQNYPQSGQGWGQQGQQPQGPQWGQPAQPQQQWGQPAPQAPAAPAYGQPAQPQAAWGSPVSTSGGGSSGDALVGKMWALYASAALAIVAAVTVFLPWISTKVTAGGESESTTITPMGSVKNSAAGHSSSGSADGIVKTWAYLIVVAAVIAVIGAVLVLAMKNVMAVWALLAGAGLTLIFAIAQAVYFNGKLSDAKTAMKDGGAPDGAKYSIGLGWAAYLGLVVALAAVVFAVLTFMSIDKGASASSAAPYGSNYGQAAGGYGQPAQAQQPAYGQPQQHVQQQWGQAQPPPQQQWGQQDAAPQQQWGQQQANPFGDPANQPTQAVQQQYPPQPPQ